MRARLKSLPIGIQTFEEIINDNYLYIDKSKIIYELISTGKTYFLSRPRRFGKSLLISTLEAIFKGKKELFKDLWIYDSSYSWDEYPIIRLDLSRLDKDISSLRNNLQAFISSIADNYGCTVNTTQGLGFQFGLLIETISKKYNKPVVVLVDEYDKPIIDHVTDPEKSKQARETLRDLYQQLKAQSDFIKFIFITGVSKFSKVSVFSGLNNLKDISMHDKYASLLGYTQEELEYYFNDRVEELTQKESLTRPQLLDKIKYWYNGYAFVADGPKVYNPFSVLLLFDHNKFLNHWFETATPTYLINLISSENYDLRQLAEIPIPSSNFNSYEVIKPSLSVLLMHTGYLTIKKYEKTSDRYYLAYPNYEVEKSFNEHLLANYVNTEVDRSSIAIYPLLQAIKEFNLENFLKKLKEYFEKIPYDAGLRREDTFRIAIYVLFDVLDCELAIEDRNNRGRADLVLKYKDTVYVFEFKIDKSAEEALKQIYEKKYYSKHQQNTKNEIYLVGISFNSQERNIDAYKIEKLEAEFTSGK